MRAMIIERVVDVSKEEPLKPIDIPVPKPEENQVLIKISACGVCRTDLDEIEGRTPPAVYPVILGHQVIGEIVDSGEKAHNFKKGDRVGIGWIFKSCGVCEYCASGNENLCDFFVATGRDVNGGYAEYIVAYEDFVFKIPDSFSDIDAAPLLCAGSIGWRSIRLSGLKNGYTVGLYGFGASGHIVIQIIRYLYPDTRVFVFTRSEKEQELACELGASWAGRITDNPPVFLNVAIDTTPAWLPVVSALKSLRKGGRLIINAIRKESSDRDVFHYIQYEEHLWLEKEIKSVANVSRRDIAEFLQIASKISIKPEITTYHLLEANAAILDIKSGKKPGAKVLIP
ncbi:MAG TPA: zinc-dependent alcohol dehydrogenase family protein [Candidatus Ratteibacteria bacterium]|uniref:Alcohol dehydrogenase n=1 Tax=candidate division TA06 bacterium ADurb.Bin131 TaxID=1852827 RepID=A0A1V6CB01_UNCT6|nr:MAG: Alcohol dehydrogenase [candidate division TA06 bacterium ADurb.Bin131]HOC02131.1 zinc-dependent alcohol dehydrogenase family protein [bacterium]HRS05961.1 zinc-dependent alcohol dehydrogenase family protein [Candidatus Ratteibacteria bacterium]HON05273.1 zinc-dependent alcohol dehydrogenase family protein [bacterium]HPC29010.1 zinc-dependent alcohol dehydrogenase family protein [bacterium]